MKSRTGERQKAAYAVPHAERNSTTNRTAARVFEVMDYFREVRRPSSIREIAEKLNYPASSASVVVKTMANLGYLSYDLKHRVYFPNMRLAALNEWIYSTVWGGSSLVSLLQDLVAATGETAVIATQNDIFSQYVMVEHGTRHTQLFTTVGNRFLLCHSGTGFTLLSMQPDEDVERVVERTKLRLGRAAAHVTLGAVMTRVRETRRRGYTFSRGLINPGGGTIAMPLPIGPSGVRQVVGVASVLERLDANADEIIGALNAGLKRYKP